MLPLYRPPLKYTGELFGVEYLFRQSGIVINTQGEELDQQIDEGFEDIDDREDLSYTVAPDPEDYNTQTAACLLESDSEEDETEVKKYYCNKIPTTLYLLSISPTHRKRVVLSCRRTRRQWMHQAFQDGTGWTTWLKL